jgi:hypothetical protein
MRVARLPQMCRSLRRSRLSSNSRATVVCRIASPLGEEGMGCQASGAFRSCSRKARSLNIWASSDSSCRWCSLACSGTSSTNSRVTGRPSGASKGTGSARRMKAPRASLRPLMRPWGMAMPCPSPVEPSFSRANRLSKTVLRPIPWLFSNSRPACSKARFLLLASSPTTTLAGGSNLAMRFMQVDSPACGKDRHRFPMKGGNPDPEASAAGAVVSTGAHYSHNGPGENGITCADESGFGTWCLSES